MKIVALHHARHGVFSSELDHAHRAQRQRPFTVVTDLGFLGIEHQAGLLVIRLGVDLDLLRRERRACAVAPGWVADQAGEVTNQENDLMPQVLQLAHFVEHHGVANVDVGCCRIQTQFDAQGLARRFRACEFFHPCVFGDQLFATTLGDSQGFEDAVGHWMCSGGVLCRCLIHKDFLPSKVYLMVWCLRLILEAQTLRL